MENCICLTVFVSFSIRFDFHLPLNVSQQGATLQRVLAQETILADLTEAGYGPGYIDFLYLPFELRRRNGK